ncbi:MAG TPA: DNA-processing protein DprA [Chitinophagaceae bacterium]|jgi:DNA processing protein|nr:DNA-processing protein DprA [Chitinophagaceae bacterium]HRG92004.1 DNA-processing protein DprA [Chitinophagaceae bacterium]
MTTDILYRVALTLIPNIGPVQAKLLLQCCEPEEIFHAKKRFLEKIEGIGPVKAQAIRDFNNFSRAEKEIRFMEKYRITPLFLTDEDYPKRLLNCYDSPTLLYYKGTANLNAARIINIIGTRNNTDYARQLIEKLVKELAANKVTIMSGLAFGVDALAHKAALKNGLPTIGVLAHGLDKMYPPEHAPLAKDMIAHQGGLLTEFKSGTKPDKHHFPSRNRVVAGCCDATIVIETDRKGGSMITAELANGYNRDVFAFPGRISDTKSSGCNYLISTNKAQLLQSAEDLLQLMGWEDEWETDPGQGKKKGRSKIQKELFIELTKEEKAIIAILQEHEAVHIDELNFKSGISNGAVAAAILRLELVNVIVSLPGKIYRLS